ncbi:acyltransferase family protein [Flavobacterium muglaense]|uniref:DUF5009 domain-containing protein n=1 Tax=Flavobacterium muglaense TaxID=2764716 RepID=A0A923N0V3_9FLAO|nr:DUF5009 domain-containing protein [Flavobacterium muglaense]MBC5838045.1 DUF5009 domain-containing protein [Flavobacterium muglaense]MBC5844579.1 DUF5009 domain-containing protein [Flavobacterium muglaense]
MTLTQNRFTALDVFRGITVCFMIIVNSPGSYNSTFAPLLHARWNGFTPTDLVFPSFLFAVGNSISFVLKKWNNIPQSIVLRKIAKRTIVIFIIGFLLSWVPFCKLNEVNELVLIPFDHTRVFGVLQRIALSYGIAALLIYYCTTKTIVKTGVVLLLAYWFLMAYFGDAHDPFGLQTNLGYFIDKWLVGDHHLYQGEGVAFDPEGLLGTLPAVTNVIAGYLTGKFIQEKRNTYELLLKMMMVGSSLVLVAYFWDFVFPINKKLWTSSFVSLTIGLDLMLLAIVIYFIDFLNQTKWTKMFLIFGRNPLFIYIFSELLVIALLFFKMGEISLYQWVFQTFYQGIGNYIGSLLFAISIMLICLLVGYVLHKKKIYIKV